jgi:hypothetical protein
VEGLVLPECSVIALGVYCGIVEEKQIPRPINLASERQVLRGLCNLATIRQFENDFHQETAVHETII